MKVCLVSFFMVAIISEWIIPTLVVFDSRHGHPTQGIMYCKNNITLSVRFRSHEFKVSVIKGIDTEFLGNTLFINYYFSRYNIDEEFIRAVTGNFLNWDYVIRNDYTSTKSILKIKDGHCRHCGDLPKYVMENGYCARCFPIVMEYRTMTHRF